MRASCAPVRHPNQRGFRDRPAKWSFAGTTSLGPRVRASLQGQPTAALPATAFTWGPSPGSRHAGLVLVSTGGGSTSQPARRSRVSAVARHVREHSVARHAALARLGGSRAVPPQRQAVRATRRVEDAHETSAVRSRGVEAAVRVVRSAPCVRDQLAIGRPAEPTPRPGRQGGETRRRSEPSGCRYCGTRSSCCLATRPARGPTRHAGRGCRPGS